MAISLHNNPQNILIYSGFTAIASNYFPFAVTVFQRIIDPYG